MKIWDCKRSLNLANLSPPLACEQTGKFLTVWVLIFWRKETQKTHYWIIVLHHTEKKGHFAFPSNDVIVMHRAASLLVLLGTVCQQALWFILVDRSAISFSRSTHLCQLLTFAGWESLPFRAVQQIQPLLLQGSQKTASNNPWSLLFQLHFCQFRETLQSLVDKHWPADWCGVSLSWREHRTGRRSFQFTSWSTFQPLPMVTNSGWKTNKWDWGYKLSFVGWLGSAVDIWRELGVEPLLFHAEGNQLRWFKHLIRILGRSTTRNSKSIPI